MILNKLKIRNNKQKQNCFNYMSLSLHKTIGICMTFFFLENLVLTSIDEPDEQIFVKTNYTFKRSYCIILGQNVIILTIINLLLCNRVCCLLFLLYTCTATSSSIWTTHMSFTKNICRMSRQLVFGNIAGD